MGVGIFAARKIALLGKINNLEMMITQLSSQQMTLSDEAANIAMQQNSLKMNCATSQGNSGGDVWGQLGGAIFGGIGNAVGGGIGGTIAQGLGTALGQAIGGSGSTMSFDPTKQSAQLDNKLIEIQQKEKRLQCTMKRFESQLSMANKEYESVQKGEEKAIQRSTPKF